MTKLRWSRVAPGHYESGRWSITGQGTKWTLRCDGVLTRRGRNKSELQRFAAEDADADAALAPEPRARRAPAATSADSAESVLAALRLEVENLTLAVRELNARLDRERE